MLGWMWDWETDNTGGAEGQQFQRLREWMHREMIILHKGEQQYTWVVQSLEKVQSFLGHELEVDYADLSVLAAQALDVAGEALGQSLATCPEVPQKRHRTSSRQH